MRKCIYVIVLVLLTASNSFSQWTWINPLPGSNPIRSTMFADSLKGWFAGDCGSISRTTNSGLNWINQPSGTTNNLYSISVVDSQNVFIGGQNGIILKTTNSGINWIILKADTTTTINSISFVNISTGWAAGSAGKISRTTNGGLNWEIQNLNTSETIKSISFADGNNGWAGCTGKKLFRTTNGGTNWDTLSYPIGYTDIHSVKLLSPNTGIFTEGRIIYRTSDSGNTWTYLVDNAGYTIDHRHISFANQLTGWISYYYSAYFSEGYSLRVTTDGGLSYQTKSFSYLGVPTGICLVTPTMGFATRYNANIFKTTNFGSNFTQYDIGFTEIVVNAYNFNPNTIYATTSAAVYKSINGGVNWGIIRNSANNDIVYSQFTNNSTGYVLSGNSAGCIVSITTNSGSSWINKQTSYNYLTKLHFLNPSTGWLLGGLEGILKTTNGGTNWINYLTGQGTGNHKDIFFIDENTGWTVCNSVNYIFRTTNGGVNWLTLNIGSVNFFNSINFINKDTGWMAGNTIIKTTNSGINWVFQGISASGALNCIKFVNAETGWAVGDGGGIYFSSNGGSNWTQQTTLTFNNLYSVSFVNPNTGYIAGNGGTVLKTTNGGYVWVKESNIEIPKNHSLSQNYPNPFNPTTRISFDLPKAGLVTIKVFDVLGKEMETLVNESLKPGTYEAAFDGSQYPSGVYFYRLSTKGFTETKRMVLIK